MKECRYYTKLDGENGSHPLSVRCELCPHHLKKRVDYA